MKFGEVVETTQSDRRYGNGFRNLVKEKEIVRSPRPLPARCRTETAVERRRLVSGFCRKRCLSNSPERKRRLTVVTHVFTRVSLRLKLCQFINILLCESSCWFGLGRPFHIEIGANLTADRVERVVQAFERLSSGPFLYSRANASGAEIARIHKYCTC